MRGSSREYRSRSIAGTVRRNLGRLVDPKVRISGPPPGVRFERDVPVVVRDGTALRANVFRPVEEGRYPVLLCAQPYGKDALPRRTRSGYAVPLQYRLAGQDEAMTISCWAALEAPDPAFWVPRGYVLIVVDLRGWGHSDGHPEPFDRHEGMDVHDAIEWAAGQEWSTGRVGMSGVSYLALSQWTGASTRPPHLAAISPWEGFTDAYPDFMYPGGIRENGFSLLWSTWQKALKPASQAFRTGQKRHPLRDQWWADRAPRVEDIEIPALICGSYSDHSLHSRGSFEGFRRIGSQQKWLYTHRGPKWSTYYSRAALEVQTEFFDHFLRGDDTGILHRPPVRLEIRESRSNVVAVREADAWPPPDAVARTLFLDAASRTLGADPVAGPATLEVQRRGASFRWRIPADLDLVGPMRLRLAISTAAEDLCLFAGIRKIRNGREVVFEGSYGYAEDIVTRGWLRASHRATDTARPDPWEAHHPHTSTMPLHPGLIVELDLTLLPSATRFRKGDELVLDLRDRFFYPANPLTGQFPAIYAHAPRAAWTIHTGGDFSSSLTVPVLPGQGSKP